MANKQFEEEKKEVEDALKEPAEGETKDDGKPEKDEVAELARKRYLLSKEYCKPYFDRFLDNYKHYFLRIIDEALEADPEAYPFYSTLTIPLSYQVVETILPRMFSRLPDFTVKTEPENDDSAEMKLASLLKYQMNHPYLVDDPIYARMISYLKELFITGNAWGEVPWVFKEAEMLEHQPYSIQMGIEPSWDNLKVLKEYDVEPDWKLVKARKTVIDAPVFHHRSVFHVFPDPKKKRVSDLGWIIAEDFMTLDEIMDLVNINPKKYQNIDKLKTMKAGGSGTSKADTNYDNEIAAIFGGTDFTDRDKEEPQFKVWFMKEPYKFSIIVDEKVTIRTGDNPNGDGKIGMFLCKDIPVPGELYAWGEIDPIKKIEDALSDQTNMRNDRVFRDLLDMWKLDPTTLIDGEQFIPEPGAVVQMNDLTGLMPIEGKSPNSGAYKEYQEWDSIIQATTGATDYAQGMNAQGQTDTAQGIELMQQAANARFQMKMNLFENMALKAMGTMYVQRNRMFFDTEQTVDGEDGPITVTAKDIRMIRGNVNFLVTTGSTEAANTQKELQKWKLIGDFVAANKPPFNDLTQESIDYIGKRLLIALGEREPEKILLRKPPAPPVSAVPLVAPAGAPAPEDQIPPELAKAIQESQAGQDPNAQPNTPAVQENAGPQQAQPVAS